MRGTVAKRIRKTIYGDNSTLVRNYDYADTRRNIGLRKEYQDAKKKYYVGRGSSI